MCLSPCTAHRTPWPWLQSVPPAESASCLLTLLLSHCTKQQAGPGHPDFLHREAWACLPAAGGLASPGPLLWATARPRASGEAGPGRAPVGADAVCCPRQCPLPGWTSPAVRCSPKGSEGRTTGAYLAVHAAATLWKLPLPKDPPPLMMPGSRRIDCSAPVVIRERSLCSSPSASAEAAMPEKRSALPVLCSA